MHKLYFPKGLRAAWRPLALAAALTATAGSTSAQAQCTPVSTFPYSENFDAVAAGTIPSCITVLDSNGDSNTWTSRSTATTTTGTINFAASAPNALVYLYNPDGTTAANDWFFSAPLQLRAGYRYQVSFKYKVGAAAYPEKLEVKFGTAATAAGQTTTVWQNANIINSTYATTGTSGSPAASGFTPTANGTYYVGFHAYSAADEYFLAVDDIQVTETVAPACAEPTALNVSNVQSLGATINFTAPTGTVQNYTVVYGPTGFNPASAGTTVTPAPTASPVTLSGLAPSTGYDVYVRTNCSATSQSVFTGPVSFTTPCLAPTIGSFPYTENFDGVATGSVPCGVGITDANGDNNTWTSRSTATTTGGTINFAASAPNALVYLYNANGTTAADDWFFTPALLLRAGSTYQLSFKYKGTSATFPEKLEVKYGTTDATPAAMTTTLWQNANITNATFNTAGATAGTGNPAVAAITPTANGTYYLGFHVYSAADQYYLSVDDIQVTATVVNSNSARLNRAVGVFPNPSSGELKVDVRGANAPNGLQVEVTNLLGQRVFSAEVRDNLLNTLNLSHLTNGMYQLRVRDGQESMVTNISIQK